MSIGHVGWAAATSLALAAGLHAEAAVNHASLGWSHAALFAGAALTQAAGAVLVLAGSPRRILLFLGVANLVFVGAWALSRTVGLPVLAPTAEPVAARDALAAIFASIALAGLLVLAVSERPRGFVARRATAGAIVVLAMLTLTTSVAGAVDGAGHGAHAAHGESPITAAITHRVQGVHVHGLGGPDLDPGPRDSARADARTIRTGGLPVAIVATEDAIWVANRSDGTLSKLNPSALHVDTVHAGGAPAALAFGFGSLWVADFARDVVLRVDATTGAVIGEPVAVEPGPAALAVAPSGIWVTGVQEGTVQRIDPQTMIASTPIPVGYGPVALAATQEAVWVLNALDRAMVRIEQATGKVSEPVPVPAGAADLVVAFGRLWVAAASSGTVTPHDPETGRRAGPALVVDERTDAGMGPTGVAPGDGRLWVANNHDKTIRGIDPSSLALAPPQTFSDRLGSGPIAVRTTFAFGALWVTDFDAGSVARIEAMP
jgi:DNA-binding beta-propeller fold protein YncE